MTGCNPLSRFYVQADTFCNVSLWMRFLTGGSKRACSKRFSSSQDKCKCCRACQLSSLCVEDDAVWWHSEPIAKLGYKKYKLGYSGDICPDACSKSAKLMQWRMLEGMPLDGFLLIQKIIREAGANAYQQNGTWFWENHGYSEPIELGQWYTCCPVIGHERMGYTGYYRPVITGGELKWEDL